ncbi:hypothetical protein JCM10207_006440 [Rhodosporidiobolus poonsookiae]
MLDDVQPVDLTPPVVEGQPVLGQVVEEKAHEQAGIEEDERAAAATAGKRTFFREMLDDVEDPIPTVEQLESFGLFDLSHSNRLLAEYRSAHPSPVTPSSFGSVPPSPVVVPPSPAGEPRRPSEPPHRHSLAALPPRAHTADTPSPSSPLSPRLNPFAFVRKATIRPRPSQRAKSAGDVAAVPPLPAPSLALADAPSFFGTAQPEFVEESASSRPSTSLSRSETVKENRAPRKLRKAQPPKISVRTDDEYLLRPSVHLSPSTSRVEVTEPSPSSSSRPHPARQPTWQSASSSMAVSPVSYEFRDAAPRPPSPVSAFPGSARREKPLPPVEVKKRGSTVSSTDSYLGDNERARMSPSTSRGRFSFATPASPTTAAGMWSKLKLGKSTRGSGSRPSSIVSVDSSSTWELVEDSPQASQRSFEVLGRSPVRPSVERSLSENHLDSPTRSLAATAVNLPASASSPNLSRILEEPLDKRSSSGSTASRLLSVASIDSIAPSSGATTPAAISASSSLTIRDREPSSGMSRSNPSSNLHLASSSSFGSLRAHPPSPLSPIVPHHASDAAASSASLTSASWHSSRSSRSRDSLFYSGEEETAASSADDDVTGASSAQEEEEDEAATTGKAVPLVPLAVADGHGTAL